MPRALLASTSAARSSVAMRAAAAAAASRARAVRGAPPCRTRRRGFLRASAPPSSSSSSSSSSADAAAAVAPSKGPLKKSVPVTPDALAAFAALRREIFRANDADDDATTTPSPSSSSSLVETTRAALGGPLHASLRAFARRQCDVLEAAAVDVSSSASSVAPREDETLDVLYRHRLLLVQARRGYRCNVDSLVLASHVSRVLAEEEAAAAVAAEEEKEECEPSRRENMERRPTRIADLGAGAGVIGVSLLASNASAEVLLVEKQPRLAGRCARNAIANGVDRRAVTIRADVANLCADVSDGDSSSSAAVAAAWAGTCDVVACNPPYYPADEGKARGTAPGTIEREDAHYERGGGTFRAFAAAGARLLRRGKGEGEGPEGEERGREKRTNAASMHVIYPADRVRDAWDAVDAAGLRKTTTRYVYHDAKAEADGAPTLALVDARFPDGTEAASELRRVAPPLVLYAEGGASSGGGGDGVIYAPEIEAFIASIGGAGVVDGYR
jgi:hypothetical protein